ncbi:2-oxo acid dehydrogenase subunit E2 [Amylibacter sp.]|nr:2-oxo acid dehydrogenase subunit E2 [Amylibacter sp.]
MTDIIIPQENANDTEVLITNILVEEGAFVTQGSVILEFETSKASVELESVVEGYVVSLNVVTGDTVLVGTTVCQVLDTYNSEVTNHVPDVDLSENQEYIEGLKKKYLSEKAMKSAESGLKPKTDSAWLTSVDFQVAVQEKKIDERINMISSPPIEKTGDVDQFKAMEVSSLSMSSPSHNSTLGIEIELGARLKESGFFNNTIIDIILFESARLVVEQFNGLFVSPVELEDLFVGVAIDSGGKLRVPRMSMSKSLIEIQNEVLNFAEKYEEDLLSESDYGLCHFTVSDLSGSDISYMQPLISSKQTFILGITSLKTGGYSVFGTFDHRVTEGRYFSMFLEELKSRVSSYFVEKKTKDAYCYKCGESLTALSKQGWQGLIQVLTSNGMIHICPVCVNERD